ncbi:MAG: hypothetical protein IPJ81_11260 [Chitinophagaceae bacterium]|nr:hypothetical protein [Chitinophagaceae bacterium]
MSKYTIAQQYSAPIRDFNFIIQKIEDNYSAFKEKQNSDYQNKIKTIKHTLVHGVKDSISIFEQLSNPIMFFKDLHLRISTIDPIYFDSNFCKMRLQEVKKKSSINKMRDFKSGYWKSDYNDCIIYLDRSLGKSHNQYEAIIVESTNTNAIPGSVKFYISKEKIDKYYITSYLGSKGTLSNVFSYFLSPNILVTGISAKWTKISDY